MNIDWSKMWQNARQKKMNEEWCGKRHVRNKMGKCHRAPYAQTDIEREKEKKKWRACKSRSSGRTRAIQRWKTSSSIIVIKRNKRLLVCLCVFCFVSKKKKNSSFFSSLQHDCATMLMLRLLHVNLRVLFRKYAANSFQFTVLHCI